MRREMRRLIFFLLVCFCSAFPTAHAEEINFWAVGVNMDDVAMYRELAAEFLTQRGVAVRITPLGWGDFDTKYFAAMAAQLPPDIGITNLDGPIQYGSVGGLVDLRAEFPSEIAELEGRFYPDILPQL